MFSNVEKYANTSSAALAIADEAGTRGFEPGDLAVLMVFGSGLRGCKRVRGEIE